MIQLLASGDVWGASGVGLELITQYYAHTLDRKRSKGEVLELLGLARLQD
jgi:hypothetical protein